MRRGKETVGNATILTIDYIMKDLGLTYSQQVSTTNDHVAVLFFGVLPRNPNPTCGLLSYYDELKQGCR